MSKSAELIQSVRRTLNFEDAFLPGLRLVLYPEQEGWIAAIINAIKNDRSKVLIIDHNYERLAIRQKVESFKLRLAAAKEKLDTHDVTCKNTPLALVEGGTLDELKELAQVIVRPRKFASTLEQNKLQKQFEDNFWSQQPFDPFDL